jgi:hypothetical protein
MTTAADGERSELIRDLRIPALIVFANAAAGMISGAAVVLGRRADRLASPTPLC